MEAVFEGAPGSVGELVSFARLGPPDAQVEEVRVFEEPTEGLTGFSIR